MRKSLPNWVDSIGGVTLCFLNQTTEPTPVPLRLIGPPALFLPVSWLVVQRLQHGLEFVSMATLCAQLVSLVSLVPSVALGVDVSKLCRRDMFEVAPVLDPIAILLDHSGQSVGVV